MEDRGQVPTTQEYELNTLCFEWSEFFFANRPSHVKNLKSQLSTYDTQNLHK